MNDLKGKIKKVGDFYVKFGSSEHQYHTTSTTVEIVDWVKCTNTPNAELHLALGTINNAHLTNFENRTFAEVGYPALSRLQMLPDEDINNFWSSVCNRILFYVVQRNKDINGITSLSFQTDIKMTEERRSLMYHMTIPVTIVHSIL